MKRLDFIRSILAKCESLRDGLIAYSYDESNPAKTYSWTVVCVSDWELYTKDDRFKALARAWRCVASKRGFRLVFCYCNPKEERLVALAEQGNLLLNV